MKNFILLSFLSMLIFSGCATDIKPWEKATLAKKTIKEGGINILSTKYEEHMYFSKEATRGGSGVSGGGCGCN